MYRRLIPLLLALAGAALAAAAWAQERVPNPSGQFEYLPAAGGLLIAAPHGTYDINTDTIAIRAARKLEAGYLVFRTPLSTGPRVNVNRPTEGAGRPCRAETVTDRARSVYEAYGGLVRAVAGGRRLALYVEIHGNAAAQSAGHIETATKGLAAAQATSLKEVYPGVLTAIQREWPRFPSLRLLTEPIDRIYHTAICTKTLGILSTNLVGRALHFEFPRSAREHGLLDATATLVADLLRTFHRSR